MTRAIYAALGTIGLLIATRLGFAQAPADSTHLRAVKVYTDSLWWESCRGGRMTSSGTCTGKRQDARDGHLRRFRDRINALESQHLSAHPITTPPPPPPPPPPAPLAAPITIGPGATTPPGPEVPYLTPSNFTWNAVTGATGYVLAIRNGNTGAIVYPSPTGVGAPQSGTSFTVPANILAMATGYRWDVTAVNATQQSPQSADRYFRTPQATYMIGLTAAPRDTISYIPNDDACITGGVCHHWTVVKVSVMNSAGIAQEITTSNVTFLVSGDTGFVTEKRNNATDFEVHSPQRSGSVTITARWNATGATAARTVIMRGPPVGPAPVANIAVAFDWFTKILWPSGHANYVASGPTILCASIMRADSSFLLGDRAVGATPIKATDGSTDSVSLTPRLETGAALRTLCRQDLTIPLHPVEWTVIKLNMFGPAEGVPAWWPSVWRREP